MKNALENSMAAMEDELVLAKEKEEDYLSKIQGSDHEFKLLAEKIIQLEAQNKKLMQENLDVCNLNQHLEMLLEQNNEEA